jgi:hypothetical protein
MITTQFPKHCHCCNRDHSEADWAKLPYRGLQEDEMEILEYRDCQCDSTLAIVKTVKHMNSQRLLKYRELLTYYLTIVRAGSSEARAEEKLRAKAKELGREDLVDVVLRAANGEDT